MVIRLLVPCQVSNADVCAAEHFEGAAIESGCFGTLTNSLKPSKATVKEASKRVEMGK